MRKIFGLKKSFRDFFFDKCALFLLLSIGFFLPLSCNDGMTTESVDPTNIKTASIGPVKNSDKSSADEDDKYEDFDYEHVKGILIKANGVKRDGTLTLFSAGAAGGLQDDAETDFADLPFEGFVIDAGGHDFEWYWRSTDSWDGLPKLYIFKQNVDFTKLGKVQVTYTSTANRDSSESWGSFVICLVDKEDNRKDCAWLSIASTYPTTHK